MVAKYGDPFAVGDRVRLVLRPGPVTLRYSELAEEQPGWPMPGDMSIELTWQGQGESPTDLWFVYDLEDEWQMRFRVESIDGEAWVVDGPNFRPPEPIAMSSRYLRKITPAAAYDLADQWLRHPWVNAWLGSAWGELVRARPGRRGRDDLYYAEIAARYVAVLRRNRASPTAELREETERRTSEHTTLAQVQAMLYRARRRGLLTAAPRGRAGGELTAKSEEVLLLAGRTDLLNEAKGED